MTYHNHWIKYLTLVATFPHPSFGTIQLLYEKGYKGYN